jgi:hypothetical protein
MQDRIDSIFPPNLIDIFFHYCEQGTNSHYINTNVAIWWTCWWAYWYIINNQQMKNLIKVSTPKKVLSIEVGMLVLEIVAVALPSTIRCILANIQCGYDLGLNNQTLSRDQISEYCNNQILKTENVEEDLTTVCFGAILIVIGLIFTAISSVNTHLIK